MKCSPFARDLRKGSKHMHHRRGRFMKHLMRRCMDDYDTSSSSSSSSEDGQRNQTGSENEKQQRMEHDHGMKSKLNHDIGRKHDMRHGHGMMHRMRDDHEMMDGRRGHGMMHRMRDDHEMMDGRRDHGMMYRRHDFMIHDRRHGHGMMYEMGHDHGMKHWHGMKHGKRHDHGMDHRMKHRHGMKHKMHHGHGRKHRMGHGPGMHHKLRYEKSSSDNQNVGPVDVDSENVYESCAITFYKPKTNAEVINENNTFKISLETSFYQPEEVSVKIANGKIDVSAMHESMEDDLYEFHEMYRSFNIPSNVNPEVIAARLDIDGKLIIEAECNNQEENLPTERDIPVIRVSE